MIRPLLAALPILAACMPAPDEPAFVPAEAVGLPAFGAYPTADDVCHRLGENDLTAEYLDHTATLVGCPENEAGAIADRLAEGGVRVDQVENWVLISIPSGA